MGVFKFSTPGSFKNAKSLHVSTLSGNSTYVPPITFEYLVVAGGGGGGTTNTDNGGGGGGAGGLLYGTTNINVGSSFSLTIGAGGPIMSDVSTELAARGGSSIFSGVVTAAGGGNGGGYYYGFGSIAFSGMEGGSSGGSSVGVLPRATSPANQGSAGGQGHNGYGGGGGGGATFAGGSADPSGSGLAGKGGNGLQSSITGTPIYYAGGGGGGAATDRQVTYIDLSNTGGLGGGGKGQGASWPAVAGSINTGGGGGGGLDSSSNRLAKTGGSGVIILAYSNSRPNITSIGAGLIYTIDTTTRPGYKVYKFTAGTGSVIV